VWRKRTAPAHERPLECTAVPGDVVFVPHGWWHMVVNLDEINIAITHNYVSGSNLPSVLKFLDEKRGQISGCRDRAESIKPETLYEEFVKALERSHPDLVNQALDDPKWACRAWSHRGTATYENEIGEENGRHDRKKTCARPGIMSRAACDGDFGFSFL